MLNTIIMKSKLKKYQNLFYPALAVLLALALVAYITSKYHFSIQISKNTKVQEVASTSSLAELAKQVVSECSGISYKPTCYEEKVPALMNKISMQDAFKLTRLVQQDDPSYTYCHVLGHKLAANEVAKDPSKWLDVVDICPTGECSNGCIHGAFQQKYRSEALSSNQLPIFIPEIQNVCEKRERWNPTGLEQGTCYHALGHLLMYVTSADVSIASDICDQVAVKDNGQRDYRKLCYDGVFMQIFQPLENEDKVLIEGKVPTKEGLGAYCAKFSGIKQVSCWNEGWPLYSEEILTPSGVVKFCQHLKSKSDQDICYTDLFYVATAEKQFDVGFMKSYCAALPQGVSGRCFANTASRLIETDYSNIDKAVDVCKSGITSDDKSQCFQELVFYATFNFHPGSDEFYKICNELDEPWKSKCLKS
jgi:hypothetical protein